MAEHDHNHDHACAAPGPQEHHNHNHDLREISRRKLWIVLFINFAFLVIEVAGGLWSGSLALLADAGHMLADVAALGFALFVSHLAERPPTAKRTFGHLRAEVLGAQVNAATLFLISGLIIREAWLRLGHPHPVQGPLVLVVAIAGLAANLGSAWILRSKHEENVNIQGAFLHMLADALGSLGAVVSGAVIMATGWFPIDPIVSVGICALIVWSSWGLFKQTLNILLENVPQGIDLVEVKGAIEKMPSVAEIHDLHIWTISSGVNALTGHLVLCAECCDSEHWEKCQVGVQTMLKDRFNIVHTTLQLKSQECDKECSLY